MRNKMIRAGTRAGFVLSGLLWLIAGIGLGVVLDQQGGVDAAASGRPDYHLMQDAWDLIEAHYVDRTAIIPKRATYAAISGMVDSLGDTGHSVFLSPKRVKESHQAIAGHFPGIGAEVRMKDGVVVIVAPLDGSPAEKAGLRAGDLILKVDNKIVLGETLEQVVRRIRGPAGTTVSLSIREPHSNTIRVVNVTRAEIHVRSVSWRMLPGTHIADIRIAAFDSGVAAELHTAILALTAQGARAVVLDLRNNPGGLLTEAVAVASQFLHTGNVLLEKNVKGQIRPVPVETRDTVLSLPMVVLTNFGTASAAEIVTGALQDAKRAKVVGEPTFGTGTVLEEFDLPGGSALLLAVQEWLTPDGHTIWHKGLTPGVKVALASNALFVTPTVLKTMNRVQLRASKDAQLLKAMALLEPGRASAHGKAQGLRPEPH